MSSLLFSTVAKFAASAAVVASVGTGGAIAGVLPDGFQTGAADLAEVVGIELPRPDVTIDVDNAGEVVVEVVDGVLGVVQLDTELDWDAEIVSRTDTSAVVEFTSDTATKTVTLATDTAGQVTSEIEDTAAGVDSIAPAGADGEAGASLDTELGTGEEAGTDESGPAADGDLSGSSSTGTEVDTPAGDATLETDLDVELGATIGN